MSLNGDASMVGTNIIIGSVAASENEDYGEIEPDVCLKITEESVEMRAVNVTVESDEITLKCSYGTISVEEMMKRLERIEDQLGLPHAI